jgi:hypothetical protein
VVPGSVNVHAEDQPVQQTSDNALIHIPLNFHVINKEMEELSYF